MYGAVKRPHRPTVRAKMSHKKKPMAHIPNAGGLGAPTIGTSSPYGAGGPSDSMMDGSEHPPMGDMGPMMGSPGPMGGS